MSEINPQEYSLNLINQQKKNNELEKDIQDLKKKITALEAETGLVNTRVKKIEDKLNELQQKEKANLALLEEKISKITEKLDNVWAKVYIKRSLFNRSKKEA